MPLGGKKKTAKWSSALLTSETPLPAFLLGGAELYFWKNEECFDSILSATHFPCKWKHLCHTNRSATFRLSNYPGMVSGRYEYESAAIDVQGSFVGAGNTARKRADLSPALAKVAVWQK